ncbi:hypothetical protein T4A_9935 [Trichinella pseudospiralis]|uniref:Uncharacterized protein n=1 Tax=Trichinella pseudospiralis TaxID=6337 RepID=A0A0V1ECT7_TRIPS|nr:hypothetical protein T4A_9935 [Trichinella pseudospiralis]
MLKWKPAEFSIDVNTSITDTLRCTSDSRKQSPKNDEIEFVQRKTKGHQRNQQKSVYKGRCYTLKRRSRDCRGTLSPKLA